MLPAPRTASGRDGLAALLAGHPRTLVALDYDGTLAPVVDRPEEAVPQPGAVAVLARFAVSVDLVVITGRPADVVVELADLGDLPGLLVLGQYGAQRWRAGRVDQDAPLPGIALARAELPGLVVPEGAEVEDKGLSLVVHTRRAPDPAGALARLAPSVAALAGRCGLELHPGRLVLELRPAGHDKGTALGPLLSDRPAVLYAGDDVGDLSAFAAVRGSAVPGLLVCSDSDECPGELRAGADLVVPGPPGVVALLESLADGLGL